MTKLFFTRIWFGTAWVIFLVSFSRYTQNIPFNTRIILPQIDADFHLIILVVLLIDVLQIDLSK